MYPDPEQFLPDRFLKQEGKQLQPDPVISGAFGYGRRYIYIFLTPATTFVTNNARICPGRHLTIQAAWLAIAYILSLYTISPATDENGMKIELKRENTSGISVYVHLSYSSFPHGFSIFLLFISQAPKTVQNTIDATIKGYGKPCSCIERRCIFRLLIGHVSLDLDSFYVVYVVL